MPMCFKSNRIYLSIHTAETRSQAGSVLGLARVPINLVSLRTKSLVQYLHLIQSCKNDYNVITIDRN
jgi:hypothetical protein